MNYKQKQAVYAIKDQYRNQKYCWGKFDCNTFIADCHDAAYNTNSAAQIRHHYHSRSQAARFAKTYLSHSQWLYTRGYRPCTDEGYEFGDIYALPHKYFTTGYIVVDGLAYSMSEDYGFVGVDPTSWTTAVEHWRK